MPAMFLQVWPIAAMELGVPAAPMKAPKPIARMQSGDGVGPSRIASGLRVNGTATYGVSNEQAAMHIPHRRFAVCRA